LTCFEIQENSPWWKKGPSSSLGVSEFQRFI
jgi:hypothetical protein